MSIATAVLIGLAMGAVFGFALEKSRVFEPGMIVGQMQLGNFIMLKVFLTAVATGAVAIAALHGFGIVKLHPKATFYLADVVGGLLLGGGIALAGACPGTVLAQVGTGYRDAIFTLLGGVAGAVAFSYAQPALQPVLLAGGPGKLTFAELAGLPYWAVALALAAALIAGLYALELWRPWRRDLGQDVDGDTGTSAQGHDAGIERSRMAG
ncbi:MAG: YeeE/YedE thiosulfate transporter family protein [Thalassobaculum sp.]|uniref:YeeE/YedE thiosulfate transporter family protein n=1 Tax=Thalassobaculum sp. TaxID=2022740 RepID=UPI0032F029B9